MADDAPDNLVPRPRPPVAERPAIPAGRFTSTPAPQTAAASPGVETVEQLRGQVELLRRELLELRGQVRQITPHLFPRETAGNGGAFYVALTQTGGSNGDHKTTASYTYTAVDSDGVTVGTGLSPEWPRNYGKVVAATKGIAYRTSAGAGALAIAEEKPQTNGDLFYVALTQTAGSNGNKTAAPSYTYTAVDADGVTMGTGLSPAVRLHDKGTVTAATKGLMYQSGGTVTLVLALEVKNAT